MIRASVRRVPLAGQSQTVCVPEGASLAQLVAAAFPDAFLRRFVVVFVDGAEVAADAWDAFVPTGGHIVNLCVRPGDGDSGIGKVLRTVLQIAVIAAAQWVNAMLGGIPGALASAAVAIVGNMLINTLIPIKPLTARGEAPAAQYTVTGARNAVRPYAPVPLILGKHRIFPPLYGNYVQETVGNDIYLRVPFCLGPAPLAISDLKIGDTPISSFTGVEIEQRLTADAPPHTLYTGDPDQDVVGAQLTTSDTTRNTATGVDEIEVVLGFRTGLGGYDSKQRKTSKTVNIVVEYRPAGSTDAWTAYRPTAVEANAATTASGAPYRPNYFGIESDLLEYNTNLAAAGVTSGPAAITRSDPGRAFQYPIRFAVPRHPSGYEVRVRRTTAESTDPNQVDAVWWEILGSLKSDVDPFPEAGIASLVLRIKASAQLNNVIDTFNCVAESMIPRFSSAAKASPSGATAASLTTVGVSRNPAEIALNLYRGAQTSRPRPDTHIDWPAWAAFAKFCEDNGLHYDEVVENPIGRGELARRVCSGAYGRPVKWAGKLSVVIDRDRGSEAPAQVFTPRNVANLRWTKTFPQDTHAVRIAFNNAANGWQADEVTLYLDGYDASNATLIEQLPVPGKTDADEVRIVGRQYVNNSLRQTETFTFDMDAESLTCRLGAYAVLLHDAIDVGLGSARVVSRETSGANVTAVTLDFDIATDPLDTLAARWRKEDGTGGFAVSTEAAITRDAANAKRFVFASPVPSASAPAVGEMMLVGRTTEVALPVLVRDIAPDFGHRAQVVVIPYAPERFVPDGTPLPPHDPMVSLPIAARPAAPVQLSVAANAREIVLAFTQPVSPRGVVVTGYETAVREYGNAADSWQDRGPLPSDARVFVAPPGNPGYSYDLRVIAVGRDADGYTVKSDPLIASNVAAATTPAAPGTCAASFATRTSAGGASQLVLTATWAAVDNPDVLDTRVEMLVSTGPDVWAEIGQARAILGRVEIHGLQVGRSYTLGFVHLSRRGIASARTTIGAITAPDTLVATAAMAAVSGSPLDTAIGSMASAAASAAAADAAKLAAQSAQTAAAGSATAAAGSASTASAQATNAANSASAAAASLVTAQLAAAGVGPRSFAQPAQWTLDYNTAPASAANVDANAARAVMGTYSGAATVQLKDPGFAHALKPKAFWPVVSGDKWRIRAQVRALSDAAGSCLVRVLMQGFDAPGGGTFKQNNLANIDTNLTVADGIVTFDQVLDVPGNGSTWFQPVIERGTGGAPTVEVIQFLFENVTAQQQAAASASAAAASQSAAAVSQSAAGTSATSAAASLLTAQITAAALGPRSFAQPAQWTLDYNVAPASAANVDANAALAVMGTYGGAATVQVKDPGYALGLKAKAYLPVVTGAKWRVRAQVRALSDAAGSCLVRVLMQGFDAPGGGTFKQNVLSNIDTNLTVADGIVTFDQVLDVPGNGSTWFQPQIERSTGGAPTIEVIQFLCEEVTAQQSAVASAAAAAASQAAASASAASATSQATLSASFASASGVTGLLPNAKFLTGVTGGIPNGWANGANATGGTQQARPGISGAYVYRLAGGAGTNNTIKADTLGATNGSIVAARRYLVRASTILGSGTYNGAGVLIEFYDAASALIGAATAIGFANTANTAGATANNHTGLTSWEVPVTAPAGAVRAVVYACSHHSSLNGGNGTANSIDWYECDLVLEGYASALAQTNSGAIAGINSTAAFIESVVAAGGGDLGAFRLRAGAGGSFIELISTVLRLANVSNGAVIEVMRAIGGEAYFSRPISADGGGKRVTVGPGYGVAGSQVVLWFGPDTVAPTSQSRTNGYFSLGTDGKVYYGANEIVAPTVADQTFTKSSTFTNKTTSGTTFTDLAVIDVNGVGTGGFLSLPLGNLLLGATGITLSAGTTWDGEILFTEQLQSGGTETTVFTTTFQVEDTGGGFFAINWPGDVALWPSAVAAQTLSGDVRYRLKIRRTAGTNNITGNGLRGTAIVQRVPG